MIFPSTANYMTTGTPLVSSLEIIISKTNFADFKDLASEPHHTISGGPFTEGVTYNLAQIHWHWGKGDTDGTEHSVGGKKYAMEIHFVHYNAKYPNMSAAFENDDGAAVLAFFYQVITHRRH